MLANRTTDTRRTFYAEAASAIRAGVLTVEERDAIARQNSRKSGYWARHLYDLRAILAERQAAKRT